MPFYLRERNVVEEVTGHDSVLIVVCRFCPAASMAARQGLPYLDPLRDGLDTRCFEDHLTGLRARLDRRGVRTRVVRGHLRNFVVCMWSAVQKERVRRIASEHDAVVVMGCQGAVESVRRMIGSISCPVYSGMTDEAVLSVTPKLRFPLRVELELFGLTSIGGQPAGGVASPPAGEVGRSRSDRLFPRGGESCPAARQVPGAPGGRWSEETRAGLPV